MKCATQQTIPNELLLVSKNKHSSFPNLQIIKSSNFKQMAVSNCRIISNNQLKSLKKLKTNQSYLLSF